MKKFVIALAFAATTGLAALAQAPQQCPNNNGQQCPAKEQCAPDQCPAQQCAPDQCPLTACTDSATCQQRPCEFEGLNLTDAQKAQIKEIKAAQRAEFKAKAQAARADKKQAKADRRQAMEQGRRDYLAKIKAVLSPEQYVQYLENKVVKADKDFKRDMKPRGDKQPRGERGPRR